MSGYLYPYPKIFLFAFPPGISAIIDKISPLSYMRVTYQLHTLSPKWHIPFIISALVLRLLLLNLSCNCTILIVRT